jgi:hypothetical protein
LRLLDQIKGEGVSAAALRHLERAKPNSGYLRDVCLRSLKFNGQSPWETHWTAVTAGDILGRVFHGDEELGKELFKRASEAPRDDGAIIALSEGWAQSPEFEQLVLRFKGRGMPPIVAMRLFCAVATAGGFAAALADAANTFDGGIWDGLSNWLPAAIARLQTHDESYAEVQRLLLDNPTPGIKASIPRLLSQARGMTPELRNWCNDEQQRLASQSVAEAGMDLVAGHERLVAHSLFDLMSGRDL